MESADDDVRPGSQYAETCLCLHRGMHVYMYNAIQQLNLDATWSSASGAGQFNFYPKLVRCQLVRWIPGRENYSGLAATAIPMPLPFPDKFPIPQTAS